jgi:asparagine N-glycosylation enzyme membrane subunit Stt3
MTDLRTHAYNALFILFIYFFFFLAVLKSNDRFFYGCDEDEFRNSKEFPE